MANKTNLATDLNIDCVFANTSLDKLYLPSVTFEHHHWLHSTHLQRRNSLDYWLHLIPADIHPSARLSNQGG
jgi:hypothetical protein